MFFLCAADQYFATRSGGFNFRWGQVMLLVLVPFSLKRHFGSSSAAAPKKGS